MLILGVQMSTGIAYSIARFHIWILKYFFHFTGNDLIVQFNFIHLEFVCRAILSENGFLNSVGMRKFLYWL